MEPPPSGGDPGSRSSNINQMAYCHECNIQIRPLFTPDPTCPRCNGQFVEIIDSSSSPADDDFDDLPFGASPNSGFTFRTAGGGGSAAPPLSFVTGGGGAPQALPGGLGALLMAIAGGGNPAAPTYTGADEARRESLARARPDYYERRQGSPPDPSRRRTDDAQQSSATTRSGSTSFGPFGLQWNVQYGSGGGDPYARAAAQQAQNTQQQANMQSPATLSNFLQFAFGGRPDPSTSTSAREEEEGYFHDDGMGGAGGSADGRHFNHDNRGTYHQPPQSPDSTTNTNTNTRENRNNDLPPELGALRNLFTGLFGEPARGGSLLDILASGAQGGGMGGGGARGQWGDYVLGQQGLDDIISQLMEQTQGSNAPPPATEDVIEGLERFTRSDKARIEKAKNSDCPTCKDDLLAPDEPLAAAAAEEAGDDGSKAKATEGEESDEAQQEELISMPCNHIFHLDCLVPWLRLHGTCPVCRVSIAKEPSPTTTTTTNPSSSSTTQNPTEDPAESVPGSWPSPPNPFTSFFNTLPRPNNNTGVHIPRESPEESTTTYHPSPPASTTVTSTVYPSPPPPGRVEVVNSIVSSPPIVSDREEFFASSEEGDDVGAGGRGGMRERMLRAAESWVGGVGDGERQEQQQQQQQGRDGTRSYDDPSRGNCAHLEPDELD